jgi:hypothetical protein
LAESTIKVTSIHAAGISAGIDAVLAAQVVVSGINHLAQTCWH